MLVTCVVCNVKFTPRSLRWASSEFNLKCDACYNSKKIPTFMKGLNERTANSLSALEKRMFEVEQKMDMVETIVNVMLDEKIKIIEDQLDEQIKTIISNAEKEAKESLEWFWKQKEQKLQKQIVILSNKILKLEESKCEED